MVDICRTAKQWDKYLPHFTGTEVNIVIVYTTVKSTVKEENHAREIQKNAERWIAETVSSLSSQLEHVKNTLHWVGLYEHVLLEHYAGRTYEWT